MAQFGAKRIKRCDFLNRLVTGLKYYMILEIDRNAVDKDEFNSFFSDTYQNMLDYYLHCLKVHSIDLEEIYDSLFNKYKFKHKCDIHKCAYSARHFIADKVYNPDDDSQMNFFIETYDSLHYYLFHLFTVGLRSTKKEIKAANKSVSSSTEIQIPDDIELKECFDLAFAKLIQRMNKKKESTKGLFQRYTKCKKYDLQITDSTEDTVRNNPITKDRDVRD